MTKVRLSRDADLNVLACTSTLLAPSTLSFYGQTGLAARRTRRRLQFARVIAPLPISISPGPLWTDVDACSATLPAPFPVASRFVDNNLIQFIYNEHKFLVCRSRSASISNFSLFRGCFSNKRSFVSCM